MHTSQLLKQLTMKITILVAVMMLVCVLALFFEVVVDNHGAGGADAHRREPEVGGLQTAGLNGFQGVFEPPKMGIYIVGAEGER